MACVIFTGNMSYNSSIRLYLCDWPQFCVKISKCSSWDYVPHDCVTLLSEILRTGMKWNVQLKNQNKRTI
jgi:hypothetical protein